MQCAAKFSGGSGKVCYFRVPFSLATLTMDDGRLDKQTYLQTWRSIPNATEVLPVCAASESDIPGWLSVGCVSAQVSKKVTELCERCQSTDNVIDLLEDNNIFNTARRHDQAGATLLEVLYASMRTVNDITILCELTFPRGGGNVCKVAVRTGSPPIVPLVLDFLERLLHTGQA